MNTVSHVTKTVCSVILWSDLVVLSIVYQIFNSFVNKIPDTTNKTLFTFILAWPMTGYKDLISKTEFK